MTLAEHRRKRSFSVTPEQSNWSLMKTRDEHARPTDEYDLIVDRPESVKSGRSLGVRKRVAAGVRKSTASKKPPAGRRKKSSTTARTNATSAESLAGSRPGPMPKKLVLQAAVLSTETPTGPEWLHEIKFDGYRMSARIDRGTVRLITRNDQDWTHRYGAIARELAALPIDRAVLDGEIVALLPSGISSFQALQNAEKSAATTRLAYYVFDLLYINGSDVRGAVLEDRKRLLRELLATAELGHVHFSDHFTGDGPEFFRQCCGKGLEGVISKRGDRPYFAGRSPEWIKSKCVAREELVIGGYTRSTAAHRGIGAVLVGYFTGDRLTYCGRVGTGFNAAMLAELQRRFERLGQQDCPFHQVPAKERGRLVRWVRPELIAQLEFSGWTNDAILRHPSFQGLREDKAAKAITNPESLPARTVASRK